MMVFADFAEAYNGKEWIDFHGTFSPVVKMVTVRTVIVIAASRDGLFTMWMCTMLSYKETLMKKFL